MSDVVDQPTRSRMMRGISGKNTSPELMVRKALHAAGYRFRLHRKDLPGCPDIVLPRYRAVIFINGCFWHGHDCRLFKWPGTRAGFWRSKLLGNIARDRRQQAELELLGWRVCTIWECSIKRADQQCVNALIGKIACWLASGALTTSFPHDRTQMG